MFQARLQCGQLFQQRAFERRCATCTGNASCTCMHAISVDAVAAAVLGWREEHLKQRDKPAALPPQTASIAP